MEAQTGLVNKSVSVRKNRGIKGKNLKRKKERKNTISRIG